MPTTTRPPDSTGGVDRLRRFAEAHPAALLVGLMLISVALKVPYILERHHPTVFGDEAIFLYKAENFYEFGNYATPEGTPDIDHYHPPLYSLTLAPSFLLASHPRSVFQLALLINALLAASMIYPAYKIAESEFPAGKWPVAIAIGVWTVPFCYSFAVVSEALFIPLFLWSGYFYLLGRDAANPKKKWLFPIAVALMVMTRNAGMVMIGVLVLMLLLSGTLKAWQKLVAKGLLFVAPCVLWLLARQAYLMDHREGAQQSVLYYAKRLITSLQDAEGWLIYLKIWRNQIIYLNLASLNLLAILFFLLLLSWLSTRGEPRTRGPKPSLGFYFFIASSAMIFAGTVPMLMAAVPGPPLPRSNMYGRYADMVVPVIVIYSIGMAASASYRRGLSKKAMVAIAASAVIVYSSYSVISFQIVGVRLLNIGAGWYNGLIKMDGMSSLTVGVLGLAVLAVAAGIVRFKWLGIPLALGLAGLTYYNTEFVFDIHQRYEKRDTAVMTALEDVRSGGGKLFYIDGETSLLVIYKAKYYLHQDVREYDDEIDESRDFVAIGNEILPASEYLRERRE